MNRIAVGGLVTPVLSRGKANYLESMFMSYINYLGEKLGDTIRLHVCALDLRPRLSTESEQRKLESKIKA